MSEKIYIEMNADCKSVKPNVAIERPNDKHAWFEIPSLSALVDEIIDPPFPPSSLMMWRHKVPYTNSIYFSVQKGKAGYQLVDAMFTCAELAGPKEAIYDAKYYALREIFGSKNEYGLMEGEHKQRLNDQFRNELHASDDNEFVYNQWLTRFQVQIVTLDFQTKQQLLTNCWSLAQQSPDYVSDDCKRQLCNYLVVSDHYTNDIDFSEWDDNDDQYLWE